MVVEKEIDRILTLLRNKIRERGFTQLEVQERLGWGRSYISQLLTKQKSLRVEQVLLILSVIGVEPAEFYGELYHYMPVDLSVRNLDDYADAARGFAGAGYVAEPSLLGFGGPAGELTESFQELRATLDRLVRVLVEKHVISRDELLDAAEAADAGEPGSGETVQ